MPAFRSNHAPDFPSSPKWRGVEWVVVGAIGIAVTVWTGSFNTLRKPSIDLPVSTAPLAAAPSGPEDFVVTLEPDHQTYLDFLPITSEELGRKLVEAGQRNPAPRVVIRASQGLPAAPVQEVMAMCDRGGLKNVVFSALSGSPTAQN
jgi:biopolymer transport protein ExbD